MALDIIDEAGSEFGVKEEFAKAKIPEIGDQIAAIKKLIKACKGKDPKKDVEPFEQLRQAHDEFTRQLDILSGYWGHRLDARIGEAS